MVSIVWTKSVLFWMTLIAAASSLCAQDHANDPKEACSLRHLKNAARVDEYVFRTYLSDDGACLQILRGGKVIFRRTMDSPQGYVLGQRADREEKVPAIANGTDITGRGRPDMIVSSYTGGAHCCTIDYVFELEPEFKLLAAIDAEDSWPAYFADLDGNHHYYYLAQDWTFRYWPGDFASSPRAPVVLDFRDDPTGGGFHLAVNKMQAQAPTPEEWQKSLQEVRHQLRLEKANMVNFLPTVLWQEVLELIYTGHSDLAWTFLDEAGPDAQKAPYPNLSSFCSMLKTSPYWADLKRTLQNTPTSCASAKPE